MYRYGTWGSETSCQDPLGTTQDSLVTCTDVRVASVYPGVSQCVLNELLCIWEWRQTVYCGLSIWSTYVSFTDSVFYSLMYMQKSPISVSLSILIVVLETRWLVNFDWFNSWFLWVQLQPKFCVWCGEADGLYWGGGPSNHEWRPVECRCWVLVRSSHQSFFLRRVVCSTFLYQHPRPLCCIVSHLTVYLLNSPWLISKYLKYMVFYCPVHYIVKQVAYYHKHIMFTIKLNQLLWPSSKVNRIKVWPLCSYPWLTSFMQVFQWWCVIRLFTN